MARHTAVLLVALLCIAHLALLMCTAQAAPAPVAATAEASLKPSSATASDTVETEERKINADGYSVDELQAIRAAAEKHQFQAEVSRLMSLIINSLYSNKEIFLREAISNASDALDKARYLSLANAASLGEGDLAHLKIKIRADRDAHVLHITDNGVGMTRAELITNLGTIAKSGTKEFLEKIAKGADASNNLIGQFGVGFYSYFLVADRVVVTSKHNDDEQHVWESDAINGFSVAKDPHGNTLGRGTRISLYLKEEFYNLLEQAELERLVTKYSEFITFPIYLWASSEVEEEVPLSAEEIEEAKKKKEEEKSADEEALNEDAPEEKVDEEVPTTKKVNKTVWDWKLLNAVKPIWTRNPSEVTEEEYNNFYKALSKDTNDPLAYIHFNAEGEVEFQSILFIPARPPPNMWSADTEKEMMRRVKLYVRRVFITDKFDDMLPRYLMFIAGMVDSLDMPLNVSRELLQNDRTLMQIRRKLVRKAIAMIQTLAENAEKYEKFWTNFGNNIKLGAIEDRENRPRLTKLLRFYTSKSGDKMTSLDDYVGRLQNGQTDIYYLCGESKTKIEGSPLLERLMRQGYEVIYGVDPIDEYALNALEKYDSKYKLQNVAKDDMKWPSADNDEAKEDDQEIEEEFRGLTFWFRTIVPKSVEKVIISKRLTTSPCALVASGHFGMTANMERISRAQALQQGGEEMTYMQEFFSKKALELNPRHPLVRELNARVKADSNDPVAKDIGGLLYETAVLHSGYSLENSKAFADRVVRMLQSSLGLDANAQAELEPLPEPTEADTKAATESAESRTSSHHDADDKDEL